MSLLTQQIKVREISQAYLRIEENTEFLTNIFKYTKVKRKSFIQFENQSIDVRSIFRLIVQFSYILYTCYMKKTNIYLSKNVYCFTKRDNIADVYIEYMLEIDFQFSQQSDQKDNQKYFNKYILDKHQNAYGEYVIENIQNYIALLTNYLKSREAGKSTQDKIILRQLTNLQGIIKQYLRPNIKKIGNPKAIIMCLQQSQMFRQNSVLLKILNNSIYSAIKFSQTNDQIFKTLHQYEDQIIKKMNQNKAFISQNCRQIQESIEECLKLLIKKNIISSEQSLNDTKNMTKTYILGEIQGLKEQQRKFVCRIKLFQRANKQFNEEKFKSIINQVKINSMKCYMEEQTSNMKQQNTNKSDYVIQYIGAKNLICVKYITNIQLNIQNTDLIMFQCNNISFNWNSVSMQLVQKSQSKVAKRKQRFVAFKTLAQFSPNQKPFFKILLLIDLVMICAKISQPQLRKTVIKMEDYWRIQEIGNKINHMINLFIKKIDKFYKNFSLELN